MSIGYSVYRRTRHGQAAPRWTIQLTYADGRRREITGYTDRRATEQKAAQLVRELERKEVGLHDPYAAHRRAPLGDHLVAFLEALAAGTLGHRRRGRPTQDYLDRSRRRLQMLVAAMENPARLGDLSLEAAQKTLAEKQQLGWSDKTRDDHANLLRQFGAWLVETERWATNPFARLRAVRTQASRTFKRRALGIEELQRLVDAAEVRAVDEFRRLHLQARPETLERRRRLGAARGLGYLLCAFAGLRRREVSALVWSDVDLGEEPAVTVRAAVSKNRKEQRVAIPRWLAGRLTDIKRWRAVEIGTPPRPDSSVLRLSYRHLNERLKQDALYARLGTLDARGRVVDGSGAVLDLHSLRGLYATLLGEIGVPMKVLGELMRHSDPRLTIGVYAKVRPGEARSWVERLPEPGAVPPASGGDAARRGG